MTANATTTTSSTWEEGVPISSTGLPQAPSSLPHSERLLLEPIPRSLAADLTRHDIEVAFHSAFTAALDAAFEASGEEFVNDYALKFIQEFPRRGYKYDWETRVKRRRFFPICSWDNFLYMLSYMLGKHPAWFLGVPAPAPPYPNRGEWPQPLLTELEALEPSKLSYRIYDQLGIHYRRHTTLGWSRGTLPRHPLFLFHISAVLEVPLWRLVPTSPRRRPPEWNTQGRQVKRLPVEVKRAMRRPGKSGRSKS